MPANQRNYAWTEEHAGVLFSDFAKAYSTGGDYFVGSLVTIPKGQNRLEVVDGQQRLATTAILLAAMRDYLADLGEARSADSVANDFLTEYDMATREDTTHLRLNVDDNDLFTKILTRSVTPQDREDARGSRELLLATYAKAEKQVRSTVAALAEKDHHAEIVRWKNFVQFNALALLLQVASNADAFRMFETLNDRGLKASQADMIKNYLFSLADDRLNEVSGKWTLMRGALESLDDDDVPLMLFLRHALIALTGYLRESDTYETVQKQAVSTQGAVTFASQLEQLSTAYVSIFNPEHERWTGYPESVKRSIEVANLFNLKPMRPLMLAIAMKMEPQDAGRAYSFLVSLGVRLLITTGTRSASVEVPLANTAAEVFKGEVTTADELRHALRNLTPTDAAFADAFSIAKASKTALARYYLRTLEQKAKGRDEPYFIPNEDPTQITLEHVLPRSPQGNWDDFGDSGTAAANLNRIGNLALLRHGDNSNMHSDAFADKRPIFVNHTYETTAMIGGVDEWTPDAIASRQVALAALAVKAWPV